MYPVSFCSLLASTTATTTVLLLALPDEMLKVLEKERKERYLETIPETV